MLLGAVDSLNPTATALQIYLLTTPKPVVRSTTFIFGVFVTYWAVGLLAALGFSRVIANVINSAGWFIYVIQFILGVVLIAVGCTLNQSSGKKATNKRFRTVKPMNTFLLAAAVTLWEFPTALPYIAALERIVQAELDLLGIMKALAFYDLIFVLPLIVLLGIYICLGDKSAVLLKRINRQITKWSPKILQVLAVSFGLWLIVDCIADSFNSR